MAPVYLLEQGTTPLVISIPHAGTGLPPGFSERLSAAARDLPDTDWHVERLYAFASDLGASVLRATVSRYVIDLNRPPDGESLYPGQPTTGLCPDTLFDGRALYREGAEPDAAEVGARLHTFWQPYQDALAAELARVRAAHGVALLYDAHSIRSQVPRLFEGTLPDFNIGTVDGGSCDPSLQADIEAICRAADGYSTVVNGRFRGGHITRHYGNPGDGVHAVQMELAQTTYMTEAPPYAYDEDRAEVTQSILRWVLEAMLNWAAGRRS